MVSATIARTGSGNITLSGNQIGLDGTRTRITGAGGVLTLQPVTPGTTVGFGSGAAGTLNFTNAQLAAIGGTFSAINVGNLSAGRVEIASTLPASLPVAPTAISGNVPGDDVRGR